MTNLLISIGMMSLQASMIIGIIFILRKLFSILGISKKYMMLLWIIPFFFLVFPWKISVADGFWQQAPTDYVEEYEESGYTNIFNESGFQIIGNTIVGTFPSGNDTTDNENVTAPNQSITPNQQGTTNEQIKEEKAWSLSQWLLLGTVVWLMGVAGLFLHSAVSYMKLKKQLCFSIREEGNIYRADNIEVPMVYGIIKPKIYVPSNVERCYIEYVVEHEKTHILRKDPITKMVMYFIACLHWFNPFVWAAYIFMAKDMEMACDEETLQRIGLTKKKQYATALLELSCGRNHVLAVPLAFAEGDSKRRIKNVLAYRKTVMAVAVIVVLAGLLLTTFFLTKDIDNREESNNTEQGADLDADSSENGDDNDVSQNQSNSSTGNQGSSSSGTTDKNPTEIPGSSSDSSSEESAIDKLLSAMLNKAYIDRELTEEEIKWFNEEFFAGEWNGEMKMANMFLGTYYRSPEKIDLYDLFREGTGTNAKATAEERAALEQIMDEDHKWLLDLDSCKSPVSEMEQILNEYMGLSVSDCGTRMETFYYLEEYDAYYTFHGDTSYKLYQMDSGYRLTDGSVLMVYYVGWDWDTQAPDERSDIAVVILKEVEEGKYHFVSNLLYVEKEYVTQSFNISLPEGYELGEYNSNIGLKGGYLISPQCYENLSEYDYCPEEWNHSGCIEILPNTTNYFGYENGKMTIYPKSNHSWYTTVEYMTISEYNVLLVHADHDLYVMGQLEELENKGYDLNAIETNACYWDFYLYQSSGDYVYHISLCQKEFSKEEAIAIVETFSVTIE